MRNRWGDSCRGWGNSEHRHCHGRRGRPEPSRPQDAGVTGMSRSIWEAVGRFFGPSQNERFAALLLQLADTAVACAAHFRKTDGQDLPGIIDFEHRGDAIVDEIHELLDNAFILRFDVADCMRLTDDLDNVIDGMRKVAFHIDIYKPLRRRRCGPRRCELFAIGERMMQRRARAGRHAFGAEAGSRQRARAGAADRRGGVRSRPGWSPTPSASSSTEYSPPSANRLEFIAWQQALPAARADDRRGQPLRAS